MIREILRPLFLDMGNVRNVPPMYSLDLTIQRLCAHLGQKGPFSEEIIEKKYRLTFRIPHLLMLLKAYL
jgi:hypothetical protein